VYFVINCMIYFLGRKIKLMVSTYCIQLFFYFGYIIQLFYFYALMLR
jgi:hypothetical protein